MKIYPILAVLGIALCAGCGSENILNLDQHLTVVPVDASVAVGQSVTFRAIEGTIDDWSLVQDLGNHPTQGAVGQNVRAACDVSVSADRRSLVLTVLRSPTGSYPFSVWLGTRRQLTSVDSVGQWIHITMTQP